MEETDGEDFRRRIAMSPADVFGDMERRGLYCTDGLPPDLTLLLVWRSIECAVASRALYSRRLLAHPYITSQHGRMRL